MALPPLASDLDLLARSLPPARPDLRAERPEAETRVEVGRPGRALSLYPASLGYELQEELEFLSNRAMEPNIFFSARLLAPAMPRVEDKKVRFALIRDETEFNSRLRLLMPFTVERPGFAVGAPIIRTWANPFGPLGTPLVDGKAWQRPKPSCPPCWSFRMCG
jgi:hypothetical protein